MRSKMAINLNRFNLCEFSSVVSIKNFKKKVQETVDSEDLGRKRTGLNRENIASEMGVTEETLAELDEVCRCDAHPTILS